MDINQPFVTQEQKFKYWEESKSEIQTLRAKVASAEFLVEALHKLRTYNDEYLKNGRVDSIVCNALATYDKLSEIKHDTNK